MLVLLLPSLEGNMRADGSRDQMKSPAINELPHDLVCNARIRLALSFMSPVSIYSPVGTWPAELSGSGAQVAL